MRIGFRKLTDERHVLSIRRDDGTSESVELETRSFLLHDLVHYAVEAEACIEDGFWGLLASGTTLGELKERAMGTALSPGLTRAESLVGPMQSVWNGRLSPALYVEQAGGAIDGAFIERVRERLRALTGHWRGTPFRTEMEIEWPPPHR
jgi:hypothetical protein